MATNKRKRESDEPPSENGERETSASASASATASASQSFEIVDSGFSVMTVRMQAKWRAKLSKAGYAAGWGELEQDKTITEIAPSIPTFGHRVKPDDMWRSMKKYKQFVVNGSQFSIGEHIYINNHTWQMSEKRDDDQQLWVARVMEVRADGPVFVRLRVMYLYWPDELPCGRLRYHGRREMIMSNHMDILDAQCVQDRAEVHHLSEDDPGHAGAESEALYWRQTYDVTDGKVSTEGMRIDCVCKQPHNPEKLLIECKNESCKLWNHERCLEDEACRIQWQKTENGVKEEEGDSINVETTVGPNLSPSVARDSPASGPKKSRRRSKISPKKTSPEQLPWQGHLTAAVERNPAVFSDITGVVRIHDSTGAEVAVDNLLCLKCHTPFV